MSDEAKVAIDKTALAGFIRHALDSHAESAQLRTLLDLGAAVVILPVTDEEGEERIELHLVHEKRPGHASRRRHPRRGPPSRRRRSERQLTE